MPPFPPSKPQQTVVEYTGADLYPKQREAIFAPQRISIVEASTKAGKAQPLDALVYTPTGPKPMGEVEPGDAVLTVDGVAEVVGVYPQGEKEIFRITFIDGTSTECTPEHLWEIHKDQRSWATPRVLRLDEIMAFSEKSRRRMWIPCASAVAYEHQDVPMPPYLLGALLGDGGLRHGSVLFSNQDPEVLETVAAELDPELYELRYTGFGCDYRIAQLQPYQKVAASLRMRPQLAALGLAGKGSHDKHIPECYRYNSEDIRWAVLNGIFDTDGSVDKHGQPILEQTSAALALDVAEIVQSLGGMARIHTKQGSYRDSKGAVVPCRTVYRLLVVHPDAPRFFSLSRKKKLCRPKKRRGLRGIRNIEFVGMKQAQCIEINDARGLYLTDHLIATHNTVSCLAWLLEEAIRLGREGRNFWWIAPVFGQAEIGYRRMKLRLPKNIYKPNQSTLTLTLANGARIQFRSGERSDDLYGEDVYAAVIDEASRMREESWHAIRSTLTQTRGRVRIIGNVRGRKNWFYELARVAESGTQPDMAYFKLTAYDAIDAGVLDPEEIASAKRHFEQLGQEGVFRQLYLAEAAEDGDNPFGLKAIRDCIVPDLSRQRSLVAGVDLAGRGAVNVNQTGDPLSRDWTAIVQLDRDGFATQIERFRKPHTETAEQVARAVGKTQALIDSTGAGDPIVEMLQRRGDMRVEGYTYTERSRQDLLEGLALAIGEQRVHFPDGPLRNELESFEFRYSKRGVRFAVPDRMHDDLAMALALAVRKMPWRRSHYTAPAGVESPTGSRWTSAGSSNDAWRRYQESLKPSLGGISPDGEVSIPSRAMPPALIQGSGAGKWSSNI